MPDAFCIFYQKRASEKLLHLLDSPKVHCPLFPSLNALLLHSAHWLVNCVSPAKRQRTLCRLTNEQSRAGVRREGGSVAPRQNSWDGMEQTGCPTRPAVFNYAGNRLCTNRVASRHRAKGQFTRGEEKRERECKQRLCSKI